jgi:Ca2+-binding EF-hand superfamily protein
MSVSYIYQKHYTMQAESGHGRMDYLRATARTEDEKQEQRKAARLSLDTSAHGGSRYQEILTKLEGEGSHHARKLPVSKSTGNLKSVNKEGVQPSIQSPFPTVAVGETKMETEDSMELGGRGRSAALMALKQEQGQQENQEKDDGALLPGRGPITVKRVAFDTSSQLLERDSTSEGSSTGLKKPVVGTALGTAITSPKDLESLMRNLQFKSGGAVSSDALAHGLRQLGYDVTPAEMGVLLNQLGVSGGEELEVRPAEFVASLLDWGGFQRGNRELWLECARRAFVDLDSNSDGKLTAEDIIAKLRDKLPAEEVDFAVEDAFLAAGGMEPEDVDFEGFLRMMRVGSQESSEALELYDPRILETKRQEDGQEQHRLDPVLE